MTLPRPLRSFTLPGLCAAAILLPAGTAHAAFGVVNPVAQPATTQAGAQTALELGFDVSDPGDQLRDLTIDLPPGLVGNPQAVPQCSVAAFEAGNCTAANQVGTTTANAAILLPPPLGTPTPIAGKVFNLEPNPGEPGRLGIQLESLVPGIVPVIRKQATVQLRPDFGLTTVLEGLPNQVLGINIYITRLDLSLSEEFISNPTSCGVALTRFKIRSYVNPTGPFSTGLADFTPTGCDAQPYAPRMSVTVGDGSTLSQSVAPPLVATVEQSAGEANSRRVQLVLPAGLGASLDILSAGNFCPPASFEAGGCDPSQQVGTATARTPLLADPLTGPVYLVASGGVLPGLGLDLQGALNIKLLGQTDLAGGSRLVNTFDGLPDLPLPSFQLSFEGGPGGLLTFGPELCTGDRGLGGAFTSQAGRSVPVTGTASLLTCPPVAAAPAKATAKAKCKNAKKRKKKRTARVVKRCKKKKRKKVKG